MMSAKIDQFVQEDIMNENADIIDENNTLHKQCIKVNIFLQDTFMLRFMQESFVKYTNEVLFVDVYCELLTVYKQIGTNVSAAKVTSVWFYLIRH